MTVGEDYPRILFSRTMKKDKSRYFGPYTSAAAVKDTIELLNKLYQLRTCNRVLPRDIGIERPLPELSYQAVSGTLPGICEQRGIQTAGGRCTGISEW